MRYALYCNRCVFSFGVDRVPQSNTTDHDARQSNVPATTGQSSAVRIPTQLEWLGGQPD